MSPNRAPDAVVLGHLAARQAADGARARKFLRDSARRLDEGRAFQRHATDAAGYMWQQGASLVAECLATGKEPLFTPEHALHVLDIIVSARESQ